MKIPNKVQNKEILLPGKQPTGFTLTEILVAIAIMLLVFGVMISVVSALGRRNRDQQRITDLQVIQAALAQYYADHLFYPEPSTDSKVVFAQGGVFTDAIGDPDITSATKTYLSVPKDPSGGAFCYDARSTSSGFGCCNRADESTCPGNGYPPIGTKTCQTYSVGALMEESQYNDASGACGNLSNFYITPNKSGQ